MASKREGGLRRLTHGDDVKGVRLEHQSDSGTQANCKDEALLPESSGIEDKLASDVSGPALRQEGPDSKGHVVPASVPESGYQGAKTSATLDDVAKFARGDYQRVLGIVAWICGSDIDVPNVVAEALARLVEQMAKGKSVDNVSAWVTRAAINLGRSEQRHLVMRRRLLPSLVERPLQDDSGLPEQGTEIRLAVSRLPKRQAQIIGLRFGLDMSTAQIAEALDLSEGGIRASLFKARRNLAVYLGKIEGESNDED